MIKNSWQSGLSFEGEINLCKENLAKWSKNKFKGKLSILRNLKTKMDKLHKLPSSIEGTNQIWETKNEANNLLKDKEAYRSRCAKMVWLEKGDKNTSFFHSKASHRRKKNAIWGIESDAGVWHPDNLKVSFIICEYFHNIFSSNLPYLANVNDVVAYIQPKVSESMNAMLCAPLFELEIKYALD